MAIFKANAPAPIPVPTAEGCVLELWSTGLTVFIQLPNCTKEERQAFKKSFKRYSYLEASTPVPLAIWVWDFPPPLNAMDCNLNARIVDKTTLDKYLALENGQVKNAVTFYLLDGQIVKGIKVVGLQPAAVKRFHDTITKQRAVDYTDNDYHKYLQSIFVFSTPELFKMGRIYKK